MARKLSSGSVNALRNERNVGKFVLSRRNDSVEQEIAEIAEVMNAEPNPIFQSKARSLDSAGSGMRNKVSWDLKTSASSASSCSFSD